MPILPGLTSTKKDQIEQFVADLNRSFVRQIALFPTCLNPLEREKLYQDLEKIPGLTVPHVHIRSDFSEGELEYLTQRFATAVFNGHPASSSYPLTHFPSRFKKRLFIENVEVIPQMEELSDCGGLCLDYSHWENAKLLAEWDYGDFSSLVQTYPIGCCHLSAVRPGEWNRSQSGWDHHFFRQLTDLDYLASYRDYLPDQWLSLELENTLEEQLEAQAHLEALLFGNVPVPQRTQR